MTKQAQIHNGFSFLQKKIIENKKEEEILFCLKHFKRL